MNKEEQERKYVYENYYHRDCKYLTAIQRHWNVVSPDPEDFIQNQKIKKIENNENTKK